MQFLAERGLGGVLADDMAGKTFSPCLYLFARARIPACNWRLPPARWLTTGMRKS